MSYLPRHAAIDGINFSITERCNRACPDCCYGIHIVHPHRWEITEAELKEAAELLGPMRLVTLTGGEPSFHSQFEVIAKAARTHFTTSVLAIETNGYGFKRHPEAWVHFDQIHVTHYRPETYLNSPPNDEEIAFMRAYLSEKSPRTILFVREIGPHFPRQISANPAMCPRGWNQIVTYFKGRIYGCCSAQGVNGAEGVVLDAFWRSQVMRQELPCANCLFAGRTT